VVGSGAAGLYASLCLPGHLQIGLVTKKTPNTGASDWAQGGIAAAIDPLDSPYLHREDTLRAGAGLCDRAAVEFLVQNAEVAIASLVEMGVAFDRQGQSLAMTLEAAHSRPRVLHAADTTGRAIVTTLTQKVLERPNIKVIPQAVALSLWIDERTQACRGISLLYQGEINWISASAVILATGGGGQVYAQTTNPAVSTGDGVALAWRAGALLRDLEFVQFHPTALTVPGAPRFLISEAVRGEGAHLIDQQGRRFAFDYHPAGELAPRDVVSRAIFSHLQKTTSDPAIARVYLDLRSLDPNKIRHRFPNIIKVCQKWGIDLFSEPIPVSPAAHYWMGGIATDLNCRTSIKGLYAIGETANTGVHGANRLASNSLLECIVFAAQLANIELNSHFCEVESVTSIEETGDPMAQIEEITKIRQELPLLIWQTAGICRAQTGLANAIAKVTEWRERVYNSAIARQMLELAPGERVILTSARAEKQLKTCAETLNLLDIGYLILKSAQFRQESRGGHYRTDYPQSERAWQVRVQVNGEQWEKSPPVESEEALMS
jgi:L-aspartate oxidase